jgi:hypothetical protein
MQEVNAGAKDWKDYVRRHNSGQTTRAEDALMESRRIDMLQKGNAAYEKSNELSIKLAGIKQLSQNANADAQRLQGFVNKLYHYMSLK